MPGRARIHASIFFTFLALWTIALLVPIPTQTASQVLGGASGMFLFAKTLHVSAYAFLTLLGGSMVLTRQQRWLILAILSFHAFASEFLQQFTSRTPSWKDVGLDHIGILIGLALGWRWWRGLTSSEAS